MTPICLRDPFLLFGQMTTADTTRSPAGTESAWAYTHAPHRLTCDAGEDGLRGQWDRREQEAMADRMEHEIERWAPEFRSRVLSRRILAPPAIESMNANLLGGAINGGSAAAHQQLVFRPTPGTGRPETPVKNLYLASASAHPGGGVHGAPGANAARAARRERIPPAHAGDPWVARAGEPTEDQHGSAHRSSFRALIADLLLPKARAESLRCRPRAGLATGEFPAKSKDFGPRSPTPVTRLPRLPGDRCPSA